MITSYNPKVKWLDKRNGDFFNRYGTAMRLLMELALIHNNPEAAYLIIQDLNSKNPVLNIHEIGEELAQLESLALAWQMILEDR